MESNDSTTAAEDTKQEDMNYYEKMLTYIKPENVADIHATVSKAIQTANISGIHIKEDNTEEQISHTFPKIDLALITALDQNFNIVDEDNIFTVLLTKLSAVAVYAKVLQFLFETIPDANVLIAEVMKCKRDNPDDTDDKLDFEQISKITEQLFSDRLNEYGNSCEMSELKAEFLKHIN